MSEMVFIIPARGGSKGIPRKNLQLIDGQPLVLRACFACLGSGIVERENIYVSTDDDEIFAVVISHGFRVVRRPVELASDSASTEAALTHFLQTLSAPPKVLCLVQCTSPFISSADLKIAYEKFVSTPKVDTIFSATVVHKFLWKQSPEGFLRGVNHNPSSQRQRRQDLEIEYLETGAFTFIDTAKFRKTGNRFGERVLPYIISSSELEIDSQDDLELARILSQREGGTRYMPIPELIISDFDGVMTDNRAYVNQDGKEAVRVSRADGLGIAEIKKIGIPIVIMSSETNPVVHVRGQKLSVKTLTGVKDKGKATLEVCAEMGIHRAKVLYIGNDINDLPALELVGHPVVTADSHYSLRNKGYYLLKTRGGDGVFRELFEILLASS